MSNEIKQGNFKNYTVAELVEKYEKLKNDSAKEAFLNQTIKFVNYINFETVEVLCEGILKASCYDSNGDIKINSCKKYLMYVYCIFDQYTNIQVSSKQWMNEFNMLYKNGLVDAICQLMPDNLITTLDSVLKMKSDDMMTNYYEPHAFIRGQMAKYIPFIHKIIDNFLNNIEESTKKIDWEKFMNTIKERTE